MKALVDVCKLICIYESTRIIVRRVYVYSGSLLIRTSLALININLNTITEVYEQCLRYAN